MVIQSETTGVMVMSDLATLSETTGEPLAMIQRDAMVTVMREFVKALKEAPRLRIETWNEPAAVKATMLGRRIDVGGRR